MDPQASDAGNATGEEGVNVDQPEDLVLVGTTNLMDLSNLPTFDIRNGDPSDARSMLIKPTIPRAYHWVPIEGLDPTEAIKKVDLFVRSQWNQIDRYAPANMNDATKRKAAIILGVSRAVSTCMYRLTDGDFIPGELAPPALRVTPVANGDPTVTISPMVPMNARSHLRDNVEFSEDERNIIGTLVNSSLGILPLQGFSLHMTGHHYLSETKSQSRKAYEAVEKQFWRGGSVAAWFSEDTSMIQDLLWHKSGHPVNITLKQDLALEQRVADTLRKAGAGSAAARLPAQESEMRTANSYVAVMKTVKPLLQYFGGDINFDFLTHAVEIVTYYPVSGENPPPIRDAPIDVPEVVRSRSTAIQWLGHVLNRNSDIVALAYGFYCALVESSETLEGAAGSNTLRGSYSLVKLKTQSYASFVAGQQAFGDYTAARNARRAAGEFNAPNLTLG